MALFLPVCFGLYFSLILRPMSLKDRLHFFSDGRNLMASIIISDHKVEMRSDQKHFCWGKQKHALSNFSFTHVLQLIVCHFVCVCMWPLVYDFWRVTDSEKESTQIVHFRLLSFLFCCLLLLFKNLKDPFSVLLLLLYFLLSHFQFDRNHRFRNNNC